MPDNLYLAGGACVLLIVAAFFAAGGHHELTYRLRRHRHGGYLIGGDR